MSQPIVEELLAKKQLIYSLSWAFFVFKSIIKLKDKERGWGGNLWKISSTSKEIKKMWCLLSSVLEKLFINPFEEHYICIIYDNLPFQWITFCNPSLYIEGHSVAFFSSIRPAVIFEQCKRSKSKKKRCSGYITLVELLF